MAEIFSTPTDFEYFLNFKRDASRADDIINIGLKSISEVDITGNIDFIGVTGASIKIENTMNTITMDIKISLSQSVLNSGKLDDLMGMDSKWSVEFGWNKMFEGDRNNFMSIKRMVIVSYNIEYASDIRGYTLSLKLLSSTFTLLNDIMIGSALNVLQELAKLKDRDRSLGKVISALLIGSKNTIIGFEKKRKKDFDTFTDHAKSLQWAIDEDVANGGTRYIDEFGKTYEVISEIEAERYGSMLDLDPSFDGVVSDNIYYGNSNDIPLPEEIVTVINAKDENDAKILKKIFNDNKMTNDKFLNNLLDDFDLRNKTTVFGLIDAILEDNGFIATIMWNTFTADGRQNLRIVPTSIGNPRTSFGEYQFIGLSGLKLLQGRDDFHYKTYTSSLFDIASKYNVVTTISADSSASESSFYGGRQIQEEFLPEEADSDGEDAGILGSVINFATGLMSEGVAKGEDKTSKIHMDNWVAVERGKSKKLNIETIGLPFLRHSDNIQVNFGGDLFSGVYKIIGISHSVGIGSFTTSLEAIQLINGEYGKEYDTQTQKLLTDELRSIKVAEKKIDFDSGRHGYGTAKDVGMNYKRYR